MITQHCWLELMYDVTLWGVYSVSFIRWYAVSYDLGEILHGYSLHNPHCYMKNAGQFLLCKLE